MSRYRLSALSVTDVGRPCWEVISVFSDSSRSSLSLSLSLGLRDVFHCCLECFFFLTLSFNLFVGFLLLSFLDTYFCKLCIYFF